LIASLLKCCISGQESLPENLYKAMGYRNISLLQEVTESEVPKDVNMLCGIFPEGIADKAFPAGSPAGDVFMPL